MDSTTLQWDVETILTCPIPSETGYNNARGVIKKVYGAYRWSIEEQYTYVELLEGGHPFGYINICMENLQLVVNELIQKESENANSSSQ